MVRLFLAGLAILCACLTANAQEVGLQPILQEHQEIIAKSSRKTIKPAIDAIASSGLPQAQVMLETWAAKNMWMRKSDGLFFSGQKGEGRSYELTDFDTGEVVGTFEKSELEAAETQQRYPRDDRDRSGPVPMDRSGSRKTSGRIAIHPT